MRLAFDYGHDKHFEGYGKAVRVYPTGGPIVRPDGWNHDVWVSEPDIISEP